MKTFDDLEFKPHANGVHGDTQARLVLESGITVSVVCGRSFYCDRHGSEEHGPTYEVAMFDSTDSWIPLSEWDDVIGWQTKAEINTILEKVQGNAEEFVKDRKLSRLRREEDL